jgi:hypothetical protein
MGGGRVNRITVISGGLHRSGSTWLYNTIRIGLGEDVYAAFEDRYDGENRRPKHVVKAHGWQHWFLDAGAIVMTIRDLRAVAASAVRRRMVPRDRDRIVEWLSNLLRREWLSWQGAAHLIVRYEEAVEHPVDATRGILEAIGSDADPHYVVRCVDALREPSRGVDPLTQLHAGHRTASDWRRDLGPSEILAIEDVHGEWLREQGYPLSWELPSHFFADEMSVVHVISPPERVAVCGARLTLHCRDAGEAVTCELCGNVREAYRRRALMAEDDYEAVREAVAAERRQLLDALEQIHRRRS